MPRFGRFRDVALRLPKLESPLFLKPCAFAAVLLAAGAVSAQPVAPRTAEIAQAVDRYLALREVAFSTRPEDVEVQAKPGEELAYGVIVEYQTDDALVTSVAFVTGDASYYRSTGGGKIGGRREPLVAGAARSLVALAQVQLGDLPLVKAYPTPQPGAVRVYVLTTAGLRGAEEDRAQIQDPKDHLAALYAGGRKVVSEFQAAEP